MKNYERRWRTRRERFVVMLKPLLTQGWFNTDACCTWLEENSGWKIIPTRAELGTCLPRHPNIIKRKRGKNEWKWVE